MVRHSARESDKTQLQTSSIKRRDPGGPRNGGLMTACTQPGCTGTYNLDDYCDTCGNPAASAIVSIPAGAHRNRRRHRRVSAATAASPRPAERSAPTTVPQATACMQPGCTGTIVDQYCDVCGTPANASISVAAGADKSRRRHPPISAPAGASPRQPDRPAATAVPQTTACTQPGCTGTIVDDYCDICGAPGSAADSVRLEAAAAPAKPEHVPTKTAAATAPAAGLTAVPQLACIEPGCTGTIADDYCDVCGTPAGAPASVPPETAAAAPTPPTPGPAKTAAEANPPTPALKTAAAAPTPPTPGPAAAATTIPPAPAPAKTAATRTT